MADHSAFAELLCALAKEHARVLVVGGLARKLHGAIAEASDHTLWYDADEENAAHVYRALARVGAPLDGVEVPDLADVAYEFRYGEGDARDRARRQPRRHDLRRRLGGPARDPLARRADLRARPRARSAPANAPRLP